MPSEAMSDWRTSRGVLVPNLKRVRMRRALTQKQLATMAHVSRQTVSRAEKGLDARITSVARLARALKVDPEELQQQPPA